MNVEHFPNDFIVSRFYRDVQVLQAMFLDFSLGFPISSLGFPWFRDAWGLDPLGRPKGHAIQQVVGWGSSWMTVLLGDFLGDSNWRFKNTWGFGSHFDWSPTIFLKSFVSWVRILMGLIMFYIFGICSHESNTARVSSTKTQPVSRHALSSCCPRATTLDHRQLWVRSTNR